MGNADLTAYEQELSEEIARDSGGGGEARRWFRIGFPGGALAVSLGSTRTWVAAEAATAAWRARRAARRSGRAAHRGLLPPAVEASKSLLWDPGGQWR